MRTQEELVAYIEKNNQFMNWAAEALVPFLDFRHAKPFLKPEANEEGWKERTDEYPFTEEGFTETLITYMNEYGFDKALNHRGISASRTIDKVKAWAYALGNDELVTFLNDYDNYPQYGAPMLAKVAETFSIPQPDSREWERMKQGLPCEPGCQEGCQNESPPL